MNTIITSRRSIMDGSRKLVMENGIQAVNMRSVAAACGVAVGSVYNYFPSKADLIAATVEEVWQNIFYLNGQEVSIESFTDGVKWLFQSMKKGSAEYPGFFSLHALSFAGEDRKKGRQRMEQCFTHIRQELRFILDRDKRIRKDAFGNKLTPDGLVDIVLTMTVSLLLWETEDCGALLEMIHRTIY